MTLKDIFNKVAVAMDEVDLSDYMQKIYECADSVQREIAVFALPIVKHVVLKAQWGRIELPDDCYEPLALAVGNTKIRYTSTEDGFLLCKDGEYDLKYNAYPTQITPKTPLSTNLDIAKEGSQAMVYGICAGLCINDEPELYSAYMDRYNGILDAIITRKNRYPYAKITGGVGL